MCNTLYCSGNFFGTQATGAYLSLADSAVLFYNLHLFDIGTPHAVGSAGHLATGNTNPMSCLNALITYFTFCHYKKPPNIFSGEKAHRRDNTPYCEKLQEKKSRCTKQRLLLYIYE